MDMNKPYELEVDSDYIRANHLTLDNVELNSDEVLTTDGQVWLRYMVFDPSGDGVFRFVYTPLPQIREGPEDVPFPTPYDPDVVRHAPPGPLLNPEDDPSDADGAYAVLNDGGNEDTLTAIGIKTELEEGWDGDLDLSYRDMLRLYSGVDVPAEPELDVALVFVSEDGVVVIVT